MPSDPKDTTTSVMPKAELHCHHEGSIAPAMALELGRRHGVDLADRMTGQGGYKWVDFLHFLDNYDAISAVLRTPEDYRDITLDYYRRAAAKGLIYGEFFGSPAHAARFGLSYATYLDALADAAATLADEGVVIRIIITCVRHYGPEHALEVARLVERHPHPLVVGFGMGGDEAKHHPRDFAKAFEIARGAGLKLTSHAGEVMGPQSVRDTLEWLKVDRIGHGVRSIEDKSVLNDVVDRQIPLEVCPSSNVMLGLAPSVEEHPIRKLYDAGAFITLSSDDPPFFYCDIGSEYDAVARGHGFSVDQMLGFTRNSLSAAFCDDATRKALQQRVDSWAEVAAT